MMMMMQQTGGKHGNRLLLRCKRNWTMKWCYGNAMRSREWKVNAGQRQRDDARTVAVVVGKR